MKREKMLAIVCLLVVAMVVSSGCSHPIVMSLTSASDSIKSIKPPQMAVQPNQMVLNDPHAIPTPTLDVNVTTIPTTPPKFVYV